MAATTSTQARTVLGPLTTTFTPASSCFYLATACPTCSGGWFAQTCVGPAPGTIMEDNTDCWPPRSGTGSVSFLPNLYTRGFYSPGLVCPAGFTTACSAVGSTAGLDELRILSSLLDSETGVGCCPTGFACASSHTCVSTAFGTNSFPIVGCTSNAFGSVSYVTLPYIIANTETLTTFGLEAPLIQINWQSSDLLAGTTTASSSSSSSFTIGSSTASKTSASASLTASATSSATSTATSGNTNTSSTPLSTGAKAGIGIGAALLALALAAIAWYFARGHRRNRLRDIHEAPANELAHELPGSGLGGKWWKSGGGGGRQVHELGTGRRPVEMAG